MTASAILPRATTAGTDPKAWAFPLSDRPNSLYNFLDFGTFDDTRRLALFEENKSFAVGFGLELNVASTGPHCEDILEHVVTLCPANTILQFGTLNTQIDSAFLDTWRAARTASKDVPAIAQRDKELQARLTDSEHNLSGDFGSLHDGRRTRQFLFTWMPASPKECNASARPAFIETVDALRGQMAASLRHLHGTVQYLSREDVRDVMARLTLPDEGFTASRASGNAMETSSRTTLRLPSRDARRDVIVTPLTVDRFPASMTQTIAAMSLGEGTAADAHFPPYWAYTTIHVLDHHSGQKWLSNKLASLRTASRALGTPRHAFDTGIRLTATERLFTETLRGRVLVRAYTGINLYTGAYNQKLACEHVQKHFNSLGFRLSTERFLTTPAYIASLPFQYRAEADKRGQGLQRATLMHSLNAASLIPLLSTESGNPAAGGALLTTPRGEVRTLDMWRPGQSSYNFTLLGEDARGTTTFLTELASDAVARTGTALVLDIHGEYPELSGLTSARKVKLVPRRPISFNPFTGFDPSDPGATWDVVALLINLGLRGAQRDAETLNQARRLLANAVQCVAGENNGRVALSDIQACLQQHSSYVALELTNGLGPFATGEYAQWFDTPCELELEARATVLDFSELHATTRQAGAGGGVLVAALVQCAMVRRSATLLAHPCEGGRGPHLTLLTDSGLLCTLQDTGLLEGLLRRQRKANSSFGFVCRSDFDRFLGSQPGHAVWTHSARRFFVPTTSQRIEACSGNTLVAPECLTHWRHLATRTDHVQLLVERADLNQLETYRLPMSEQHPARTPLHQSEARFRPYEHTSAFVGIQQESTDEVSA